MVKDVKINQHVTLNSYFCYVIFNDYFK